MSTGVHYHAPKQAISRVDQLAQEIEDSGIVPGVLGARFQPMICGKAHPLKPEERCQREIGIDGTHPGIHDSSPGDHRRGEGWRDDV